MSLSLWHNCQLATMQADASHPYGLIADATLVVDGASICWVGKARDVPADLVARCATIHDAKGALITPGLIDCHTHLVYGGNRANEFEMRLNGATYEEIAKNGGGIASTVKATRDTLPHVLAQQSTKRLQALLAEGVTTVEIKSGYGLALEHERKTLQVARGLAKTSQVDIRTTFLGAHALPLEFKGNAEGYIDEVVRMLPLLAAEGLVDAVDAFCENIAFSTTQITRVFEVAKQLNIPVKLHAEQLSDSAGAQLAASFGALSCDHLEWLSDEGAAAMADSDTVAVLLPAAFYFLRETKLPPIALLRELNVPIAISTDCNPGSSPCTSLLLILNMACTLFRLTPEEALTGVTRHAARALGLNDRGVLAAGMRADFVLWDVKTPAELSYTIGANPCIKTIFNGEIR